MVNIETIVNMETQQENSVNNIKRFCPVDSGLQT